MLRLDWDLNCSCIMAEIDLKSLAPSAAGHIGGHAFQDADRWNLIDVTKSQAVGIEILQLFAHFIDRLSKDSDFVAKRINFNRQLTWFGFRCRCCLAAIHEHRLPQTKRSRKSYLPDAVRALRGFFCNFNL